VSSLRRGLRSSFSSLAVRNYRLFFVGQGISIAGTFMQMTAQSWLVLNLTGSAAALGIVTAFQFTPTLLLSPYAGVIADRVDKRRLLLATQVGAMALAFVLGILALTGVVQLWMVMGLAAMLGIVSAFDSPARQVLVSEMVGSELLTNALTLNNITMNVGRLLGPAVAGAVIAGWDLSICFLFNGASYIVSIATLAMMRTSELLPAKRAERAKGQLREGLRYVWSRPTLLMPLLLMLLVGTLTYEFLVTLPVLARDTFGTDAAGYGVMQSAMSIGAIVGGLVIAAKAHATFRTLGLASVGFGAVMVALAVSPTFGFALGVLLLVGATSTLFTTLINAMLLHGTSHHMRSRVMALYSVAFVGSTPIGGPIVGWIAQTWGVRWAIALGGFAALAGAGLVAWAVRAQRRRATDGDGRDDIVGVVDAVPGLVPAGEAA
jgi:MFS family permease